jgi:hypothetical protein
MINAELSQNYGGCLTASDLKKTYGRAYTPQELGEILKLDRPAQSSSMLITGVVWKSHLVNGGSLKREYWRS